MLLLYNGYFYGLIYFASLLCFSSLLTAIPFSQRSADKNTKKKKKKMAKSKANLGIQNRHIYTRASYLYQAAHYLATCSQQTKKDGNPGNTQPGDKLVRSSQERKAIMNLSRQVVADMRSVSLKAQIRQSPSIKQTICRYCDTVLIEGKTCRSSVKNPSKGGRKPWADVLVTRCATCGNVKRYPVSAPRQKRRARRTLETPMTGNDSTPSASAAADGLST